MPFIRITVFGPALTVQQVTHLQRGTTDLMTSGMRKPIDGTSVVVEQIGHGGWSIAGEPVSLAAQVDAVIGKGTNSRAEKAEFMADMMALLRTVLGPALRDETYIVIHEIDPASYGRGGLTRAQRDLGPPQTLQFLL